MKKKTSKWFSLVELLATILIISIILGIVTYFAINTINTSKEKSNKITLNNIKSTTRIYIKENPDKIIWISKEEKLYSCVNIKTLINKGLLKKSITDNKNINPNDNVIITKDLNGNIISEETDNNSICNTNIINIPTNDMCYNTTMICVIIQHIMETNKI